ncbi:MAG: site-specific integrase [Acidobacteria bacterium]|nr:site-specific integrase [Acidobacteriota bacterium]
MNELTRTNSLSVLVESAATKAQAFAAASRAKNTIRAYESDWMHFATWCSERNMEALPAKPEVIALYLADNAEGLKLSTLTRRLASISKMHQSAGLESPATMRHAAVKDVLSGIKRTKGATGAGKDALLTADLRKLVAALPALLIGKRDAALLLLGFAGGFRRGELAALQFADLNFAEDGLRVILRRGKTDQEGLGRTVGIPYGSTPALCPVRCVRAWLEGSAVTEGAVFRAVDRHGNIASKGLTDQVIRQVVQRTCEAAGIDAARFSAHSLRSGLVTQAIIGGASELQIMAQTGHKSTAMLRRYFREVNLFRDNAAARLGL